MSSVEPRALSQRERDLLSTLGRDLELVWDAPTTNDRDRKELMRLLIEEVVIQLSQDKASCHLVIRWKGGAVTELDVEACHRRAVLVLGAEQLAPLKENPPDLRMFAEQLAIDPPVVRQKGDRSFRRGALRRPSM